jgi:hypothetical protein
VTSATRQGIVSAACVVEWVLRLTHMLPARRLDPSSRARGKHKIWQPAPGLFPIVSHHASHLTQLPQAGWFIFSYQRLIPKSHIFRVHEQDEEIDGLLTSSYSKILDSGLALAMSSEVGFLGCWKTHYK